MNRDEYEHMYRLEDSHWWFVARRDLLRRALDRLLSPPAEVASNAKSPSCPPLRLLDVGCGTGGTLDRLRAYGNVIGLDLEPTALQFCRERGWRSLVYASATALPFPDASFDAVVALDVLEHIPDHVGALREMARVLAPGGVLLLTVPAYPSLWSGHDVALMHQRRYVLPEMADLLRGTPNVTVERLTYTVSLLLPAAWTVRRFQRLFLRRRSPRADAAVPVAPWLNTLLLRLVRAENALALRRRPMPFGLTIFAAARKMGPSDFVAARHRETVAATPGA